MTMIFRLTEETPNKCSVSILIKLSPFGENYATAYAANKPARD